MDILFYGHLKDTKFFVGNLPFSIPDGPFLPTAIT